MGLAIQRVLAIFEPHKGRDRVERAGIGVVRAAQGRYADALAAYVAAKANTRAASDESHAAMDVQRASEDSESEYARTSALAGWADRAYGRTLDVELDALYALSVVRCPQTSGNGSRSRSACHKRSAS